MSKVNYRLDNQLTRVQGNLDLGTQKLKAAQEISQYNKIIHENLKKRSDIIFELGEEAYRKIRNAEILDPVLAQLSDQIITLDQNIFHAKKLVSQLNNLSYKAKACISCGNILQIGEKYCHVCGQKLDDAIFTNHSKPVTCPTCQEENPQIATYCTCCGNRLKRHPGR